MDNVESLDIANYRQWLLWTFRNSRKVPLNKWGEASGVDRDWDFMAFEDAVEASERLAVQGVAFVFTKDDPFFGIDLDNSLEHADYRTMKPWAQDIAMMASSYTETSPSLTGLKIFCKGKLPDGARNRFTCNDGEVEIYEHGRFFTVTGFDIYDMPTKNANVDVQPIYDKYAPKVESRPVMGTVSVSGCMDIADRVRNYLGSITMTPGSRNNTVFSAAGHIKAFVDHSGRCLPDMDLLNLLNEWNDMQCDPISVAEVAHAANSAWRNGTPRELKYPGTMELLDNSDVDMVGIMGMGSGVGVTSTTDEPGSLAVGDHDEMPYEITPSKSDTLQFPKIEIPGLIGDITRHIIDSSLYPQPELAFAAALSLMSVVTGQKVADQTGIRTNLFVCGLAPAGAGKDYARTCVQDILTRAGAPEMFGPQDIASAPGLLSALGDISPVMLFPLDEMGILLEGVNSGGKNIYLAKIGKAFLELYGSAGRQFSGPCYANTKQNAVIDNPHCSIYATSTPSTFWEACTRANLTSGLLARFMLVEGGYVRSVRGYKSSPVPNSIINAVREWVDFRPTGGGDLGIIRPQIADMTSEAQERIQEHRWAIEEKRESEGPEVAALWSRVAEKSQKIALLIAAGRTAPGRNMVVDAGDMDLGILLSNWCARFLISKMSNIEESQRSKDLTHMTDFIKSNPAGVTTRGIGIRFRNMPTRYRQELLTDLVATGCVVQDTVETNGRHARVFRPALNRS